MIDLLNSDARRIPLADSSVQCIITSPPYWGLRDYGTAIWQGGDLACDHVMENRPQRGHNGRDFGDIRGDELSKTATRIQYRDTCAKCGAIRIDAQIGLERTPDCLGWTTGRPCGECYVCHIVAVMRECWRVLRDDGVCWLNLGDSYAMNSVRGENSKFSGAVGAHKGYEQGSMRLGSKQIPAGLKPKDLCMVPARVALALQANGWYLRSEIVWSKPNPMPESVTDRPTKAHEMIYLLTKEPRYYYDAEVIKEPIQESSIERAKYGWNGKMIFDENGKETFRSQPDPVDEMGARWSPPNGRNRRSVWTVATQPYSGAHFATFPPTLVEPMILAGTSARGACPTCGKAWARVIDKGLTAHDGETDSAYQPGTTANRLALLRQAARERGEEYTNQSTTLGWRPACNHYYRAAEWEEYIDYADPKHPTADELAENERIGKLRDELLTLFKEYKTVPCIVLDPFAGSGTVGKVAVKHGRRFVGCELNREYIDLAFERTSKVQTVMQL